MGFGSGIAGFVCFIADALLGLIVLAIVINAILSWLVAFDVINYRNRFVAGLAQALDTIVSPILAPLRRIVPLLGGLDITPIIALLIIHGIRVYLLPPSCFALGSLLGGL